MNLEKTPAGPREKHWSKAGKSVATIAIVAAILFAIALLFGLGHQRGVRAGLAADARDRLALRLA